MNPNSKNQLWSRWTAYVTVPFHKTYFQPSFQEEMKRATATYYRKLFGSASEMEIKMHVQGDLSPVEFVVVCRTEGRPANEPIFRKAAMTAIAEFFGKNLRRYGQVNIRMDVHIEAGDPGNGNPPSQLIMVPAIDLNEIRKEGV